MNSLLVAQALQPTLAHVQERATKSSDQVDWTLLERSALESPTKARQHDVMSACSDQ